MTIHNITAAVLFVRDLDTCLQFYRDTLGFGNPYSDPVSHAFRLGEQDFVILTVAAAAEMVGEEAISAHKESSHTVLLCAGVEDVDAEYEELKSRGLKFIKPPKSQAWGRRTAYFADPEGNLWELWQSIETEPQK